MKRIIFVDDDENVGQAMRRMLRPMRNEWDMAFAESGEEALELMAQSEPFDIVVSDMQMPGMHGSDFLTIVMDRYPETIRFALTGSPGGSSVIRTASIVHQYLLKPYDPQKLMQLIVRTFALREQLDRSGIRQILLEMGDIPSVPALYRDVLNEIQSETGSVARVAEIIERDIGMSAKLLQIVNSSAYGLRQEVTNVLQASSLLGLGNIRSLVLAAEALRPATQDKIPPNFKLDWLWSHSLRVAAYAKKIALLETNDQKMASDASTAGLLHDIGQLVLATKKTDEFGEALRIAADENRVLIEVEKEMFGATHAEIGGYLMKLWGLADPVTESITFHTVPSQADYDSFSLVTALHAANCLCEDMDDSIRKATPFDTVHMERVGLADRIDSWRDACREAEEAVAIA